MDIEWHSTCLYDYLEIRDGGSEQSEVLTKLCGDEIPNPIQTTQNEAWIRWGLWSICGKKSVKYVDVEVLSDQIEVSWIDLIFLWWSSPQVTNQELKIKILHYRFHSDVSNNGFGFLAEYSTKVPSSPSDQER